VTVETEIQETPLTGGGRTPVARRGGVVARKTGPWAESVHALLRHLANVGFQGAPRVVEPGFDEQGREVLTFTEGEIIHPDPWTEEAIDRLGRLLRRLHEATASFRAPEHAIWQPWFGRTVGRPDIFGHCDVAPWNIIVRQCAPIGLIDWEFAGPVSRLTEVAIAAWHSTQLYDDDIAAKNGLPSAAERLRQVRTFVEAYELSVHERRHLSYRMIEFAVRSAANEVIGEKITPDSREAPGIWGIAWRIRSAAWLLHHRCALEKVLA
jgi:Ser/Thr protein kinase RdoA (MazF antagonist)